MKMNILQKPLLHLLRNQNPQFFGSFYNSISNIYNKKSHKGQNKLKSKRQTNRMKAVDNFHWVKRMHGSLLSDVSLPLPTQEQFDSGHLHNCLTDNLLSLVWDVEQIDDQATALLIELWRRMDSMTAEQIISVADIFFINNLHSTWYVSAMTVKWMEAMENVNLTPSQLTRLIFHSLAQHRSTPPGLCLALENSIIQSMESLSLNQLAVICQSFFTSQTRIRSMELLDRISVKLIQEFDSLSNWYLPIFMKTMRFSNFIKISFYRDLGETLLEKNYLDRFRTLAQIMHIAHTYASVRTSHPKLFSYILKTCCQARYKFRLKDLSKLIWACGTLITNNAEDIMAIQKILTYLEHNLSLEEALNHPDNLVEIVSGLCFLNIYSHSLLNMLFHPKNVVAVIEMEKGKEKFPQINIIDKWLEIEYPDYRGNQLNEEARNIILSRLGNFSVEDEMSIRKGLSQAVDALTQMLGKDKVLCTKLLPHYQAADIFLIWDALGLEFIRLDEVKCLTGQENGRFVRLALQILSNMQTSYDGKPLGMLHTKLRQLEILGYKPVMVYAEDALRFVYSDSQKTGDFLLGRLSEVVGTDLTHLSCAQMLPK